MNTESHFKKIADYIRNSATIKMMSIGLIILILLIPESMVSSLMRERESRRDEAVREINQKWGDAQTITGPFITIPFKSFYRIKKDQVKHRVRFIHILPETIRINGRIDPEIRYRGIYEAVLYSMKLEINGKFKIPELNEVQIDPENILWEKAGFSIGITDMRGIRENIVIKFNGDDYKADPGLKTTDITESGVQSIVPLSPDRKEYAFSLKLNLNGSEQIDFIPVGDITNIRIASSWPSPSFNGAFLPDTRNITDKGFHAEWNILRLNRNFPQLWVGNQYSGERIRDRMTGYTEETGKKYNLGESAFGLGLLITADIYQKSIRISKYAVMFIVFTFSAFFFSEIINKNRVHPIQYILIGLAVILFYVLLLSISEHLNFNFAYIISSLSITILITVYTKGILKSNRFTATVFGVLATLYSYLYIVLQLEDYALLMGAVGLFMVLSAIMYITRKIDWYALRK